MVFWGDDILLICIGDPCFDLGKAFLSGPIMISFGFFSGKRSFSNSWDGLLIALSSWSLFFLSAYSAALFLLFSIISSVLLDMSLGLNVYSFSATFSIIYYLSLSFPSAYLFLAFSTILVETLAILVGLNVYSLLTFCSIYLCFSFVRLLR